MNWVRGLAIALLVLAYLRSPIDLIPDRIGWPGLLDDLLLVIGSVYWLRRRAGSAHSSTRRDGAEANRDAERPADEWDPYAVLGVQRGATAEDITRAYRERMKQYHPDHVAHLGPELQELAHRKSVEIQRAYQEIRS